MLRNISLLMLGLLFLQSACRTVDEAPIEPPMVLQKTIVDPTELGEAGQQAIAAMKERQSVRVPATLVEARVVVRPRAELREGPGAAYFLEDKVLSKDDLVVVLDRYFRWRKVVAIGSGSVGWVHEKTLSQSVAEQGQITLALGSLPSLFAASKVRKIFDFETSKAIKMQIPKGARFYRLKKVNNKYLVLIEDTLSVAWINEGDVI